MEILGYFLILCGIVAILTGLTYGAHWVYNLLALPRSVRDEIKRLRSDLYEISGMIDAHHRCAATASDRRSEDFHLERVKTLSEKYAERQRQIESLKATSRQPKRVHTPKRAPAPELNPKWKTPACYHEEIEPVYTESAGDKPVAWVCVKCLEPLEENSPEAKNWNVKQQRKFARAKADAEWRSLWSAPANNPGEVERENRRLEEMAAIVKARDEGRLSAESAKELLNNEPAAADAEYKAAYDRRAAKDPTLAELQGDDVEIVELRSWGSSEPILTIEYDKGGHLPAGAVYLPVMPKLSSPILDPRQWAMIAEESRASNAKFEERED